MSSERLPAIPEKITEKNQENTIVNSENIESFLLGFPPGFSSHHWEFSDEISLPVAMPHQQNLYSTKNEVYIQSQEEREHWEKEFRKLNTDATLEFAKGEAERSMVVLFDPDDGQTYVSDVVHGSYYATPLETYKYMKDGYVPLLEMHTHPDDALPSALDYRNLVTKGYNNGRRVVNGILVLCPNFQILVLARPTTPVLEHPQALEFVNKLEDRKTEIISPMENRRFARHVRKYNAVNRRIFDTLDQYEDIKENVIERRMFDGAISQYEGIELLQQLDDELDEYADWLSQRSSLLGAQINLFFLDRINRVDNVERLRFIQQLDLQVYMSTNMRDFRKWTA